MEKLKTLYSEMLGYIDEQNTSNAILTSLFPLKGKLYDNKLMVVGRAVNGWDENQWARGQFKDLDKREEYLHKLFYVNKDTNSCPLEWVQKWWGKNNRYNTKKSAFWRIVNKTMIQLGEEDNWSSKIIWSNLYKVAPASGGNPSLKLRQSQQEKCIEILKEEIRFWKPERVLFLTGIEWITPFLDRMEEIRITNRDNSLVEASGTLNIDDEAIGRIIIAKHPQGKNENDMMGKIKPLLTPVEQMPKST